MAIKSESPITPVTRASSTSTIMAKSASERALVDNDHIDPLCAGVIEQLDNVGRSMFP